MRVMRSRVGAVFAALYLCGAVYIAKDEIRNHHGDWINLSGFGTVIVTAPSQILIGPILRILGVAKVNYADLGLHDYAQIALHILVTATIVYVIVAGVHWLCIQSVHFVRRRGS